jgi:peroxiredoxin Q/BCP
VFKDAGAQVIGICSDSVESHQQFAAKQRLPFILLSDKGGTVRKRYGVAPTLGVLPGRVTYIIDKQGIVRHIFSSFFAPKKHAPEALKVLQALVEERT